MRLRRSGVLGRSPLAGGGPELLPTKSSVKPSRCSQPETSMSPGSVRNHQPWTPACSGTGHGSLNTSSRVKGRAARKSLTSVTRWLSDMTTPIVVPVPRAVGSAEGGGDRRQVEVVPPHGDLAIAHLEHPHYRKLDLSAACAPHPVGPLVHHDAAVAELAVHLEVDAVEPREHDVEELPDGLASLRGRHRNVVVDPVIGEVTCDLVGVGVRPQLAELGDQLVGGLRHALLKRTPAR